MILERKAGFLRIFLRKLKERKIIHTLAAFIAGGAALIEFARHILVGHYHLPKIVVDYIIAALIIAMLSTVSWQWFLGEETLRQQARRLWKKRFKRIAGLIVIAFLVFVAAWQFTPLPEFLGIAPQDQESDAVSEEAKNLEAGIQATVPKEKKITEVVVAEKQEPKKPEPAPVEKAPPKLEKVVSKPSEAEKEKADVSRTLDKGITAFNQGDLDECIRQMKEVLNLDPGNTSAQYFLSEAKKRQSEKAKEQEINNTLKVARDAFQKGDYQDGVEQVKKVLGLDPQNAEARKLIMQTRLRTADQQAKALVNDYIQAFNSNNLLAFYEKACAPQLFQRLKKRTESSMRMFESFQSTASDIKTQFRGLNQAEISFFNNITGISKTGLKQEIFNGYIKWRVRRAGDNWRIVNITTNKAEKK
jgi:cytochrome c-type biogenesis protein CcmH/NrfG